MPFFDLNKKAFQWATLFFLAFIWGSSFILMKRGLEVYTSNMVAALRIGIAFIVLFPFAVMWIKKVEKKYWFPIMVVGLLGNFIPAFLFTKAQTEISSSLTGMLNSLTPIFTLIIALFIFKQKIKKLQILGVFIGLIGALSLIFLNGIDTRSQSFYHIFLIVLATLCYAIAVNTIKNYLKNVDAVAVTSLAFLAIGPWSLIYLFNSDFINITKHNPLALSALLYVSLLAIFGTTLAVIVFNMLIKNTTSIFATSVTYLIPVVAIFWGFFDGETILLSQIMSIIIILIGIYFINKFL